MAQQTDARPASSWRVVSWWTTEVVNPSGAARALVPTIEQQWCTVHSCESVAHAWDQYRSLSQGRWVPAEATSWGVDEPWKPHD
jgi:hypothetical protein